jgi:hypothetical protein
MKMILTMEWKTTQGSSKVIFQKMPIDRATKNFFILHILQVESVIREYLRDFEGTNP